MKLTLIGKVIRIESQYSEKDICKNKLKAWWDGEKKQWYIIVMKTDLTRMIKEEQLQAIKDLGFQDVADEVEKLLENSHSQSEDTEKAKKKLEEAKLKNKYDLIKHPKLADITPQLKLPLLDYQLEDVNFGLHRLDASNNFCIFSQVGSGKTLQALAISLTYDKKVLVVCPASLKRNWEKEIEKFTHEKAFIIKTKKDLSKIDNAKYIIVNYDIISVCEELFKDAFVIADEVHYVKNREAKRTQAFFGFLNLSYKAIFLTGTPMRNGIPDAFTLFSYCSNIFPKNYYKFCDRYSYKREKKIGKNKTITVYSGVNAENKEEFLIAQDIFSVRRRTRDVVRLPNMQEITQWVEPEPLKNFVDINIKDDEDALLDFIKNGGFAGATEDLKEKMSKWKKANAQSKAKATAEYAINSFEEGNPMVIFSDHPDACKTISEELEKDGMRVGLIIGGTSLDIRADYIAKFQNGELDAIVATIGCLATGVTLHRANITIFNDIPWLPSDLEQAKARIYRIGQERDCTTIFISGTELDDIITNVIRRKVSDISTSVKNY